MEKNVNYTVVGAFVIILITAIVLAIIWLSADLSTENYLIYKVYMKESVSGLNRDSPVEYNGVHIGSVASIKINPQNPKFVDLLLRIKQGTPVTRGTRAKLDVRALSGVAFIQLEDKGTDMTPLKALPGDKYPVIDTIPSFFLRLNDVLTQLNDSFRKITDTFGLLFDKENLHSLKSSFKNIDEFTTTLSKNRKKFETIIDHADKAAQILETQTLPDVNQVVNNFDEMSRNLSDVSNELKQNPSVLIRGKQPNNLGPGEK